MKIDYDLITSKYFNEALETLKKAITIDTAQGKPEPKKPFGPGNHEILNWIMQLAQSWGFKPVFDDDYYYAYIDYGEGKNLFLIAPHLDIVPTGDVKQWNKPPFEPIIKDNKLYGRGALDDKGPAIMNLYALKYLKDHNYQTKDYRIRLVFGVNEEGSMECLKKYAQTAELPKWGYTPDGAFPCVYAEKAIINADIYGQTTPLFTLTGGQQYNIVNDVVYYSGPKMAELTTLLTKQNLKCEIENQQLRVSGIAAHGSMPELGINAGTAVLAALQQLKIENSVVKLVAENFHNDFLAQKIFGDLTDETGPLSVNLGITEVNQDGNVRIGINFRVPALCNPDQSILPQLAAIAQKFNFATRTTATKKAIYWPKDSYLVQTCSAAYQEITNNKSLAPMAVGGGTYAKVIPNMIAFGMIDDYANLSMHQVNEWVSLDKLKMALQVYVNAIVKFTS